MDRSRLLVTLSSTTSLVVQHEDHRAAQRRQEQPERRGTQSGTHLHPHQPPPLEMIQPMTAIRTVSPDDPPHFTQPDILSS